MLQALELIGFKSFADKTRFEFPPGITVVVGPNGSGKSNVVDAIKWVLGEQSAKSLRGREMADVIFNGSSARRPLNAAEITLTLDNAQKLLAVDTPEVHITRRVYRSGEGEYLINRQPSRLRDIRELFAGTGIATEAYSVIEQGKVDVMLQSSARDRRIIFEEAAGISRFKHKKVEAQRRLERVEQNLLRLSDIIDEVESRLRSVRLQAAKARRFREYSQRLQDLRTQVALVDWRKWSAALAEAEGALAKLREQVDSARAEAESLEANTLALETDIVAQDEVIRQREFELADNRQAITTAESLIDHERIRSREQEHEQGRYRRQLAALCARAGDMQQQFDETVRALAEAESQSAELGRQLADEEREVTQLTVQLDHARSELETCRTTFFATAQAASSAEHQVKLLETRLATAELVARRAVERQTQLMAQADHWTVEVAQLLGRQSELERESTELSSQFTQAQATLVRRRQELTLRQRELAELTTRRATAKERASVLEELEARLEGVSAGVKQVLAESRRHAAGPFHHVRGLVAEVFQVNVEMAGVIDVALGERAGYVVVEVDDEWTNLLLHQKFPFAGRVGFVPVTPPSAAARKSPDFAGRPGVVGRADRFVQADRKYAALAERLLGTTWIVDTLSHALLLAASAQGEATFVTRQGEVVATDGVVVVGPRQGATGLISRRSELRALRERLAELDTQAQQTEQRVRELETEVAAQEQLVAELDAQQRAAAESFARQKIQSQAALERQTQVAAELATVATELEASQSEQTAAAAERTVVHEAWQTSLTEQATLATSLEAHKQRVETCESQRQTRGARNTALQVELAKSEQRLEHLRTQMRQFEHSRGERARAVDELREHIALCQQRGEESLACTLRAESQVAALYLVKEDLTRQTIATLVARDQHRHQRAQLAATASQRRSTIRKLEEAIHERELAVADVRHQRATLADRLREDYALEIAELEHQPTDAELHERETVEQEIADLRRKLNSMGGVNLDALSELDELETRFQTLSAQHQDLSAAKTALASIIEKINADSRRLFAETLETIRGHFQQLFRKLFGGGQADIVLEEGVDMLDGGIEIVARPPGKEPRNISLLSGGEKTLTAVALLLAIFRSRPSPFCVLDEVDAALDEANIERFVGVLKEFLAWTQFIVVTHSKKTMTAANTLYGITMQESGVSKRVSVRFDDVSDNGEIRPSALQPSEPDPADDDPADDGNTDDETQAA